MTLTAPVVAAHGAQVRVDRTGRVLSPDRAAEVPQGLADWAAAFLRTGRDQANFCWRADGGWLGVRLARVHAGTGEHALLDVVPGPLPHGLTDREIDVTTLVALGYTNPQIAERLGTRTRTVSTQVERVLAKLALSSRSGLAAVAVDHGLLRAPVPGGVDGPDVPRVAVAEIARAVDPAPAPPATTWQPVRRRPYLLGAVIPTSGHATPDGVETRRGLTLGVRQVNARGGVAGRPVETVVVGADFAEPDSVTQAFETLHEIGVDAICTSYATADHPASLEPVAGVTRPYLHTATYEEQVQLVRSDPSSYGMVFHTCPSELYYGTGFVRLLDDLAGSPAWQPPGRDIVVVEADTPSSRIANDLFLARAERSGWDVADVITVPLRVPDWGDVIDRLHQVGPAAVLVAYISADAVIGFQRAFAAAPTDALVHHVYGPSIPRVREALGPDADGMLWSTVTGVYDDPLGARFRDLYRREHGTEPGWSQAGCAYDQVNLLAAAWAATGGAPQDVAEYLRGTVHRGVNGVYFLGTEGQCALLYPDVTPDQSLGQAHLVYQVQDGRNTPLGPAPHGSTAAFRTPAWCSPGHVRRARPA